MVVSQFDEYPLQQIPSTFDHVEDSDRRWYERVWSCIYNSSGDTALVHGLGVYPNANLMDGFVSLCRSDRERRVFASRSLGHDRMRTVVGPLSVHVIRGLQENRLRLAEGEAGFSYDLTLNALDEAYHRIPLPLVRSANGEVLQSASVFVQRGHVSGELVIDGETIDAHPDTWSFVKTNSWGLRAHSDAVLTDDDATVPGAPFLSMRLPTLGLTVVEDHGEIVTADGGKRLFDDARWTIDGSPAQPDRVQVEVGGWLQMQAFPLLTTSFADGRFGAYADYFDGLYRGDDAYGSMARVTVESTSGVEGGVGVDLRGRRMHLVSVQIFGEMESAGVGILELAAQ